MKTILSGINSRQDEAEHQITDLEDKQKSSNQNSKKKKRIPPQKKPPKEIKIV